MPESERLVVADTSPLLYLHHARKLPLLRALYGTVVVPSAVRVELAIGTERGHDTPDVLSIEWIRSIDVPDRSLLPAVVDLGPGESEVIALCLAHPGSLALLDDRLARRIATVSGLAHTGTLGVLLKAKSAGLLDSVRPVLENLRSHGMRMHDDLERRILRMAGESDD